MGMALFSLVVGSWCHFTYFQSRKQSVAPQSKSARVEWLSRVSGLVIFSDISVDMELSKKICTCRGVVSVVSFSNANSVGIAVEVATDRISIGSCAC
jgi:hypothetical protein